MSRSRALSQPVVGSALIHPVALCALVVLVLNDHVLKSAYPGFLTGKLSDAAGLVVFPLFLHAVIELIARAVGARFERFWQIAAVSCAAVTALAFGAVKSSEDAAELFRTGLGSLQCLVLTPSEVGQLNCRARVICDSTDLWTLPFVLVAVLVLARAQLKERPSSNPSDAPSTK